MDRKEFLQKIIRWSLAGGLAVLGISLFSKTLRNPDCKIAAFCAECKEYDKCDLPQKQTDINKK